MLLLVVIEDRHFVALDGELDFFAKGDVGGLGPGEVEFFADDVGLRGGLDGEDLIGVGVFRGVGGGVFAAVFVRVGVVRGGASGGDFLFFGVHQFAGVPVGGEGEGGGEEKCGRSAERMRLMGFPLRRNFVAARAPGGRRKNILSELDEGTCGAPALSRTVSADGDRGPESANQSATLSL